MQRITNHPLAVLIIVSLATLILTYISVFQPKLPTLSIPSTTTSSPEANLQDPNTTRNNIVAASQKPGYSLMLSDQKGLDEILSYLKVWDKTYEGKDTIPLKTMIVFLADKPQINEQKDDKGNTLFSYSMQYERDAVAINIYLPDTLLKSPSPSAFFGASLITIASKMGETNKTLVQIPNNNLVGQIFKIEDVSGKLTPPPAQ